MIGRRLIQRFYRHFGRHTFLDNSFHPTFVHFTKMPNTQKIVEYYLSPWYFPFIVT